MPTARGDAAGPEENRATKANRSSSRPLARLCERRRRVHHRRQRDDAAQRQGLHSQNRRPLRSSCTAPSMRRPPRSLNSYSTCRPVRRLRKDRCEYRQFFNREPIARVSEEHVRGRAHRNGGLYRCRARYRHDSVGTNYTSTSMLPDEADPAADQRQAVVARARSTLWMTGGTAGPVGTAWAWYTLSPNWASLWPRPIASRSAYDTAELRKIAILMTDGEYNTEYDVTARRQDRLARRGPRPTATRRAGEGPVQGHEEGGGHRHLHGRLRRRQQRQRQADVLHECATDADASSTMPTTARS